MTLPKNPPSYPFALQNGTNRASFCKRLPCRHCETARLYALERPIHYLSDQPPACFLLVIETAVSSDAFATYVLATDEQGQPLQAAALFTCPRRLSSRSALRHLNVNLPFSKQT